MMASKIARPCSAAIVIFAVVFIILFVTGVMMILCVKLELFYWKVSFEVARYGTASSPSKNNSEFISLIVNTGKTKVADFGKLDTFASRKEVIRPIKISSVSLESEETFKLTAETQNISHHSGNFRRSGARIWDPHPEYEFSAFGKLFHLILKHDSNIAHPSLKVTVISKNFSFQREPDVNVVGCLYSGSLRNEPDSNVVVSLCDGMTGLMNSEYGSYFIEPAEQFNNRMDAFLHNIYQLNSENPTNTSTNDTDCEIFKNQESLTHFSNNGFNCTSDTDCMEMDESQLFHSRTRTKRSADVIENVVELMVAADNKMAEYHGSALHTYILMLLSMVRNIYKDRSIGNHIDISLVKLIVLSDSEMIHTHSSSEKSALKETLNKFCMWQQQNNNHNDLKRNHHDCALLLSRGITCKLGDADECDKLGLANLGTMCKENCCAVIRDNGFSTAFTIAHELGHLFGMRHDEDEMCLGHIEKGTKKKIMTTQLGRDTHPWKWSACSRHFLTEFLGTGDACLHNNPINDFSEDADVDELPGEKYAKDKQCELMYGKGYRTCSHMNYCSSLYCTMDEQKIGCHSNGMPVAEGTPCGPRQWCQQGECILKDGKVLKPVDGGWGPWQPFGECSRSCGGGIKRAYRNCDNPVPKNGGKLCLGKRVKYQSCNFKGCPVGTPDFRFQQCAKFNDDNSEWVPHFYGMNENNNEKCKLYCRKKNTPYYYLFKDKVIDGTTCGPNTYDMCVYGVCLKAGCDHILNSNSVLDTCGICGGNNTTCKQILKQFNMSRATFGYSRVMMIPAGASNIDIQQRGLDEINDDNYLALIDAESGMYLLNGNLSIVRHPKKINYEGIILDYSGSDVDVERINTSQPLHKDLILEVLSVGNLRPPNITCHYTVPISPEDYFRWNITDKWTDCSKVCNGEQQRIIRCAKIDTNNYVSEESCSGIPKPEDQIKNCNQHCNLSWDVITKTECSSLCGIGFRILTYSCFQNFIEEYSRRVELPLSSCKHIKKPSENQTCFGSCDIYRWKYYGWQPCTVTCGSGVQTREAVCVDENGNFVVDAMCEKAEKVIQKLCILEKCSVWWTGDWSDCSATCGLSKRTRQVRCQQGNRIVPVNMCASSMKPSTVESCEVPPCAVWIVGKWSNCSVSCGTGEKMRSVHCSLFDENLCNSSAKPPATEVCTTLDCSPSQNNKTITVNTNNRNPVFEWVAGDWESCSVSCGFGMRRRTISCYNVNTKTIVDNRKCNAREIPNIRELCSQSPCPEWRVSQWSSCSVSCGQGISIRSVWCEIEAARVSETSCIQPKPENTSVCDTSEICETTKHAVDVVATTSTLPSLNNGWKIGRWGECSLSCGGGVRIRHVVCQDGKGNDATNCNATLKPEFSAPCNTEPCFGNYYWKFGEWSECNAACGSKGKQRRKLFCFHRNGKKVKKSFCKFIQKPNRRRKCTLNKCEPRTCLEVKRKLKTTIDREYSISVLGRNISVYCHRMWSNYPLEYLSLPAGDEENFSEVFGKRLPNLGLCSGDRKGTYSCPCLEELNLRSGITFFRKIRLNITSLQIVANDFTFTKQVSGSPTFFAEAADCYSTVNCPRGSFSINLKGTGLRVSPSTLWVKNGINASMEINTSRDNRRVVGKCSGYCAICRPAEGLKLDVLPP